MDGLGGTGNNIVEDDHFYPPAAESDLKSIVYANNSICQDQLAPAAFLVVEYVSLQGRWQ